VTRYALGLGLFCFLFCVVVAFRVFCYATAHGDAVEKAMGDVVQVACGDKVCIRARFVLSLMNARVL
jgi:hypothetical protein